MHRKSKKTFRLSLLSRQVLLTLSVVLAPAAQPARGVEPAATELPEVHVSADAEKEGSAESGYRSRTANVGPLGKMSLQDAPYSINVIPGELIENTDAHSVADALKTNPTVFVAQSQLTDARGFNDAFIRGFKPSYLRDGLYVNSYNMPLVEGIERMEVLNGPTAFLYGYVNPGGTINYVTRKPTTTPTASVRIGTYGGGQFFSSVDLGGPLGADDRFSYRLNAFVSDGDTFVDKQKMSSSLLSLDVDWRVTPDLVLKPHVYHTEFDQRGAQGQFLLGAGVVIPSVPDVKKLYGQPWTHNEVVSDQVGIGADYRINDIFKFRFDFNHSNMHWTDETLKARLVDNAGNYTEQFQYYGVQHYLTNTAYAMLDASFDTVGIHHDLSFGYWGSREHPNDLIYNFSPSLGTFNINSPTYVARPNTNVPVAGPEYDEWNYDSLLIGDRVTFNEKWGAVVGANRTFVHELYMTYGTVNKEFRQVKWTPSLSLIYKPVPWVSLYGSYIEALVFGSQAPTTANNPNEMLSPTVSKQYEIGAKATVGQMDIAAALFQIDRAYAEVDPADNVYKDDGREVHRGIELTASGKPTDRLTLVGGLTWLDAHVSNATANPRVEGKVPLGVPERMARIYAEYALPSVLPGLVVNGGANYTGRAPTDAYNAQFLDSFVTFDAGLRYETKIYDHKTQFNLRVNNLFDKAYWLSYTSRNGLQFGEPRTVSVSLKTSW